MELWEATNDIKALVEEVKSEFEHLTEAHFWTLLSDQKPIRGNKFVVSQTKRVLGAERLNNKSDFKIIISAEAWAKLTDAQKEIYIYEALCRCGVKYKAAVNIINKKKEKIKDDLGRVLHTKEKELDKATGSVKWKINKPEEVYLDVLSKYGAVNEDYHNVINVVGGARPVDYLLAVEQKNA